MRSNAESFEYKELGECLELIIDHRGKTPRKLKSDWVSEGVPTISAKNVNGGKLVALDSIRYVTYEVYEKWMKEDVKAGDCFLVSEGATLGECLYWDSDYPIVLGQRIFCIRTNPDILNPRYFYAYMTSPAFQSEIIARATGSSVPGLRQTEVLKLKVKIAPLDHQEKIGNLVYSINKKIAQNKLTNQTLEHIAQALFKSWFVDFEPTRIKIAAKQAGQDPERAAMAAISGKTVAELDQLDAVQLAQLKTTAALFPDGLVESELGEVPDGWLAQKLEDILELAYGKALKKTDRIDGDYPVYGSGGKTGTHNESLVDGPGIIVGRKGTVGSLYWEDSSFFPIDTVFYVKPKPHIPLVYTYYLLQTLGLSDMNTDAAVPGLNRNNVYRLEVALPSNELLKKFANIISNLRSKQASNLSESNDLESLRDTLLPKLLSGELSPTTTEVA